jgi:hypothetical protein
MNWRQIVFESYRAVKRRVRPIPCFIVTFILVLLFILGSGSKSSSARGPTGGHNKADSNSELHHTHALNDSLYTDSFDTVYDFIAHTEVNYERLLNPSLQAGNWIGNTWIPPRGWQQFSAADLRTIYQHRSILWVGDSMLRRSAATMHAVLNYNANDGTKMNSGSSVSKAGGPTVSAIDSSSVIDVNKGTHSGDCVRIPLEFREHANIEWCRPMLYSSADGGEGQHSVSPSSLEDLSRYHNSTTIHTDYNSNETISNNGTLNSDYYSLSNLTNHSLAQYHYIFGWRTCLADVEKFIRDELARDPMFRLTSLVDTLVIGVGVWEILHKSRAGCSQMYQSLHPNSAFAVWDRLRTLIEALVELQSPRLEIIWMTTGYSSIQLTRRKVDVINTHARDIIARMQDTSQPAFKPEPVDASASNVTAVPALPINLTIVDWAAAILPRSFGERIEGDMTSHYGLEPRLVMMQMMTNHWLERRKAGL